ncbi:MAG: serine hydrolase domain-containing protein [Candidatus Hydrogenedens sp.]
MRLYYYKKYILALVFICLLCNVSAEETTIESRIINFLDTHVPQLLDKNRVSGAVIALVCGDTVVLKGYGILGFDLDEPMDAKKTPVFVASLSKLFTAVGILQLYEQGKLSLDIDVNHYLNDFQIVYPFTERITIHHLLTHTAGFDDRFLGMGAKTKDSVLPLGKYLSKRLPPIVFPPGSAISYSNHGFALLGHIIEEVSGKKFYDYMRERLFEPLEMKNSRFDGTYPEYLKLPEPYLEYLGRTEKISMDFAQTPPASSLCTTAEDFSHFLIAMLNDGRYKNHSLLKPSTVLLMQTPRYKLHPLLPGYACCWEEGFINGKRLLQHSGLTWGFSSHTLIIPDERFGLFISINKGVHTFISELIHLLVGKFSLPVKNIENIRKHPSFVDESFYQQITGFYRHNRYCRSDYFKLSTFLPQITHEYYIRGNASEHTLSMKYLAFQSREWTVEEMGDMIWGRKNKNGEVASSPRISFIKSYQKRPYQFTMGNDVYEPIYFWETKLFQYVVFFACMAVCLLNLWIVVFRFWVICIALWVRKRSIRFKVSCFQLLTFLFLIYTFCFGGYIFLFLKPQTLGYGTPSGLFILLIIPFFLLLLTILASIKFLLTLKEWKSQVLYDLLSLLSCYGFLFLLYYWNILDFHLTGWYV